MADEIGIKADVVYIRTDGKVLIERPGFDPVLVIVDVEQAIAQENDLGSVSEGPRVVIAPADEPPRRYKPRPGPVYVMTPGSIPIVEAPAVGSETSAHDRDERVDSAET